MVMMVMFFDLIERITRQLIYNQGVLTVVQKSHLEYHNKHLQVAAYSWPVLENGQ